MFELILMIVGAIATIAMFRAAFSLGNRIAVASETAAASLVFIASALPDHARERALAAMKRQADARQSEREVQSRDNRLLVKTAIVVVAAAALVFFIVAKASAQGLYMLNGRATPSVVVGADGAIFPVAPGPMFAGPSPVVLAPPLPWRAPPRYVVPPPYTRASPGGPPPPPCDCRAY
jgi:hypothetical protein